MSVTPPQSPSPIAPRGFSVVALVAVVGALYFGRDVLIPVALAVLLSFLLAPAARQLERLGAGRLLSTLLVAVVAFGLIGAVGWVSFDQAVSLAAKLPEYRANITKKIRAVQAPPQGELGKAAEAVKDLQKQAVPTTPPLAVKETPASPFAQLAEMIKPFAKPIGTALAVIVFTILLLVGRENMRERVIALMGARHINVTTQALGEASERVSRYLLMQLFVNACFGVPFAVALYLIGMPNAVLWGLLAIALRFIPYAGVWIAAALPAALAFAISDGWSMVAWTLGVFLFLEILLVYAVEPWLYGRSTGLSAIGIMAAAVFWTWLWGPIGLFLATPLTVCIAVLGRYIPQFGFFNLLLGAEPVLPPEARVYQRLLARDFQDAAQFAGQYREEHGEAALYEEVLLPALGLAERDRHQGTLTPDAASFVVESVARIVAEEGSPDDAERPPDVPPERAPSICIAAAHDGADHAAAQMLARLLPAPEFAALVLAHPLLAGEMLDQVETEPFKAVLISALPPRAARPAEYLCKRLRQRFPEMKIVVGLWTGEDAAVQASIRLKAAGADEVVTTLGSAVERMRQHAPFGVDEPSNTVRAEAREEAA